MIFSILNNINSIPKAAIQKFWELVIKGAAEKDCWSFNSKISNNKKYVFRKNNIIYRAHIVSFLIRNETLPENYYIITNCSNLICINPEHLILSKRSSLTGNTDNHPWKSKTMHKQLCIANDCDKFIMSDAVKYCEDHRNYYFDFKFSKSKPLTWDPRKDEE